MAYRKRRKLCDASNHVLDSPRGELFEAAPDDVAAGELHTDTPIVLQLPDSFDREIPIIIKHCSMCGNRGHNKNTCQDKSISVLLLSSYVSRLL